jgi:uncharacterized protein (DUF697 family)
MLRPEEVRKLAERPVRFGLVAADDWGYAEMENFLLPDTMPRPLRLQRAGQVHRAGETDPPEAVDLVLYQQGIPHGEGVFTLSTEDPDAAIREILATHDELSLPLARQFPCFRKPVVEDVIHSVSRENALFAITTALPNVIPSLIELPWAFGEFASDTLFLTANQIRMAFVIGAASGRQIGVDHQKAELASLAASAFGWRALARELAGLIPLGEGLIPKGAIAYAATFMIGKGLEHLYHANVPYTPEQRVNTYKQALERAKTMLRSLVPAKPELEVGRRETEIQE